MMLKFMSFIALAPAALAAQVAGSASARVQAGADAQVGKSVSASAASSTTVDAEIAVARERGLPERPIRRRVAEGRAKGASEEQVALAARRVRMNLETAHEAMVSAGRARPSDEEVERGASAMEHGYTPAQIEAIASAAAGDRSLVVAFDVLARLSERGVPTARALAEVQSKLEPRATDTAIDALVTSGAGVGAKRSGASVGANAAAGAATSVKAGAASVTGAVKGVVRP
jgi:hypothetical protein